MQPRRWTRAEWQVVPGSGGFEIRRRGRLDTGVPFCADRKSAAVWAPSSGS